MLGFTDRVKLAIKFDEDISERILMNLVDKGTKLPKDWMVEDYHETLEAHKYLNNFMKEYKQYYSRKGE